MNQPIYITRKAFNRLTFWQRVSLWLAAGASGGGLHISELTLPKLRRKKGGPWA
jgi:hypothetical protein